MDSKAPELLPAVEPSALHQKAAVKAAVEKAAHADSQQATLAGSEDEQEKDGKSILNQDSEKGSAGREKPRRAKWTIFDPFNRVRVDEAPATLDDAPEIALARASFISQLTFWWIQPLLVLGYKRELQETDLPKMDPTREASRLADEFEANFIRRKEAVEAWNKALGDGSYVPSALQRLRWKVVSRLTGFGSPDGRREVGLAMALSDTFTFQFWIAGVFKVVGDLGQVVSPLVMKRLIVFVTDSNRAAREGTAAPHIGHGIGLAIGLALLQMVYSICTAQTFSRGGQTGILARGALIAAVYRRAMKMSGKARVTITNAKLVSHISTDISRIDFCSSFFHFSWTCVLQLIEVIIILLVNIGVSSLAGVAIVFLSLPLQTWAMKKLFLGRQASMVYTDKRIKSISELLLGIKVIKMFAWEEPYKAKVHDLRRRELQGIRKLLVIRAANQAVAISIPTLAAVIVFAVYAATGHSQQPAEIWTTLSMLNLLRMPLMALPNSLSAITDAHSALKRLVPVFLAEHLPETFVIDEEAKDAVVVRNADFEWESAAPKAEEKVKTKEGTKSAEEKATEEPDAPSRLFDIDFTIPRGRLLCVVGAVGSGKSSLLQGLIGEMRKTKGSVTFAGNLAYCSQTPWSQNATIRDNVTFGQPFDETRYWEVLRQSCLLADLDALPNGDLTQIGEKGITLSGGQRQRVSIARTLYYDADIVLLDDPLSAVDAHVGAFIFENVIMGALKDKTRILATHALHVLPHADEILVMENGRIAERGSYNELMAANSTFARLSREFGTGDGQEQLSAENILDAPTVKEDKARAKGEGATGARGPGKALMQVEERVVGGISGSTYKSFLAAARGRTTVPLLAGSMVVMCAAQVLSNLSLTWWQQERFGLTEGGYSGLYAGLGIAFAMATFAMGLSTVVLGTAASANLHAGAFDKIIGAPTSFFDTQPVGRILNRFAKDIDNLDSRLLDSLRMTLATLAQIVAAFVIVAIVNQYFLIAAAGCMVFYYWMSRFYRASARSIKRHDNVLRSSLYAAFSESLAGMATVRAFQESARFVARVETAIDLENRAYLLTVINQRWLAIRLDFLGAVLTLTIAFIAVGERASISPSQVGLALATILSIQQALSMMIRQSAEVENNLSSAERLIHYQEEVEQEAPAEIAATTPAESWPSQGAINFDKIVMAYRPGLPNVLKGLSVEIRGGEKVGVVGRTGAGKSSLMLALFRLVEISSGKIEVDGLDIHTLGLAQLRSKLAIIPQDAVLFNGTLRSNLDPFGVFDDAKLWDALRRAWLVERTAGLEGSVQASRFTLETAIEDEGSNLSVGERSLVSLARALVKDSKIVVLDEATASVDAETDSRIQAVIRSEFSDKTLLVIAHRIRTIIGYDRIIVLQDGQVESFDTPLRLFEQEGIFHSLCVQSGVTREDIEMSRLGTSNLPIAEVTE